MNRRRISGYQNKKTIEVNVNQNEESGEKRIIYDSALLIGFITALGYYLAYCYKKGYLLYYGVPENIISQVDVINIIIATSTLFTIIVGPYSFYIHTNTIMYGVSDPIAVIFKKKIIPLIILGLLLFLMKSDFRWVWSSGVLVCGIWIYISPLFKYSGINGYKNKLNEAIKRDTTDESVKRFIKILRSQSPAKYIIIILLTFCLGNIVNLIGEEQAMREKEFIQLKIDNVTYLVIDVVGDNYLITPYDEKTNSIKSKFSIIDIKTDFDKLLEFENIKLKDYLKVKKYK